MDSVSVLAHTPILGKGIDSGHGSATPAGEAPEAIHNADDGQEKKRDLERHCERIMFEEKENH
jgi:hypothetical protein